MFYDSKLKQSLGESKKELLNCGNWKMNCRKYQYTAIFNRKVDLLTDSSIRNPFLRKSIDTTKILIYDGAGQKVLV